MDDENDEINNALLKYLIYSEENAFEHLYFRFKVDKVIKDQIFVTFSHTSTKHENLYLTLGQIRQNDLPEHFQKVNILMKQQEHDDIKYDFDFDQLLHSNKQFANPTSVDYLLETLQIDDKNNFSSHDQQVNSLNSQQLDKVLQSGIDCLKKDEYEKAEEFLNIVIQMDPKKTDAYVAKGCLLANQSKFAASCREFEFALKLDDKHANARRYLSLTLETIGKQLYKAKDYQSSLKAYKKLLSFDCDNEDARKAIAIIENRSSDCEIIQSDSFENRHYEKKHKKKSRRRSPSHVPSSSKRRTH